jgi:hypothetical protein
MLAARCFVTLPFAQLWKSLHQATISRQLAALSPCPWHSSGSLCTRLLYTGSWLLCHLALGTALAVSAPGCYIPAAGCFVTLPLAQLCQSLHQVLYAYIPAAGCFVTLPWAQLWKFPHQAAISPRARIFTHLRSSGIDSEESIPQAYVAWQWRAGTITLFLLGT